VSDAELALDEAMADRRDRYAIFQNFLADHLFDAAMTDADFIGGLQAREAALAGAIQHLLALLDAAETKDAEDDTPGASPRRSRCSLDRKALPPAR
jgi:hypothetical protein